MKNLITLFIVVFVLSALITPLQSGQPAHPTPESGDGVYRGGQLPPSGTLCADTPIYGNVGGTGATYGMLHKGDVVSLREMAQGGHNWVMIDRARWIPLDAVCDF